AAMVDGNLAALCGAPFTLSLATVGVRGRARLSCGEGKVSASFGEGFGGFSRGAAGGMLVFPSAHACARSLAGGRGIIIPLPFGVAFPRALRFFKAATGRAPELLRSPEVPPQPKARLLLAATAHGLAAVAGDSYLEKRMHHFPDGIVRIGSGDALFLLEKKGRSIQVLESAPDGGAGAATSRVPDAILSFASPESAIAVLSGKRQAVVALGSGEVTIAGLLPLVQGLFSVLDRLSWYLGVAIGEEGK
ncbi:MAG: hypothetical protein WC820_02195, partial [Spirochaetales bacterium]